MRKRPPPSSSLLPPRLGYSSFEALAAEVRLLVAKTAPASDASRLTEEIFGVDITEPSPKQKRRLSGIVQVSDKFAVLGDLFYSQARPLTSPLAVHLLEFARRAAPFASLLGSSFGQLLRPLQTRVEQLTRVTEVPTEEQALHTISRIREVLHEVEPLRTPKWDESLAVVAFGDDVIRSIRQHLNALLETERETKAMVRNRDGNSKADVMLVHGLFILTTLPRSVGTDVDVYSKSFWLVHVFHEALRRGNPDLLTSRGEISDVREWRDLRGPAESILNFALASLHTSIKQKLTVCLAGMMRVVATLQERMLRVLAERPAVPTISIRAAEIGSCLEIHRHRRHWPFTRRPTARKQPTCTTLLKSEATLLNFVRAFASSPTQQLLLFGKGRPGDANFSALLPTAADVASVRAEIHGLDYKIAVIGVFEERIQQEKVKANILVPSVDMDKEILRKVKVYLTTVSDAIFLGSEILTPLQGQHPLEVPINHQHHLSLIQYTANSNPLSLIWSLKWSWVNRYAEIIGGRFKAEEFEEERRKLVEAYRSMTAYFEDDVPKAVPNEMLALGVKLGKIDDGFFKEVKAWKGSRLARLDEWITGHLPQHLGEIVRRTWSLSKRRGSSPEGSSADGAFVFDVVAIAVLTGSIRVVEEILCGEGAREAIQEACLVTFTRLDPHLTASTLDWPLQPMLAELALSYLKGEPTFLTGTLGRPAVTLSASGPMLVDEEASRKLLDEEMARVERLYGQERPSCFADAVQVGAVVAEKVFAVLRWADRRIGNLVSPKIDSGLERIPLPLVQETMEEFNLEVLVTRSQEPLGGMQEADLFGSSDED